MSLVGCLSKCLRHFDLATFVILWPLFPLFSFNVGWAPFFLLQHSPSSATGLGLRCRLELQLSLDFISLSLGLYFKLGASEATGLFLPGLVPFLCLSLRGHRSLFAWVFLTEPLGS